MAQSANHVVAQELAGVIVELIGFVDVYGLLSLIQVDRWFAGKRPGMNVRIDQVGAPWGAVAGHEEPGCDPLRCTGRVWRVVNSGVGLLLVAEVREDVDGPRGMVYRCVDRNSDVDQQQENERQSSGHVCFVRMRDSREKEVHQRRGRQDMQRGQQWVDEPHFLVGNEREHQRHE